MKQQQNTYERTYCIHDSRPYRTHIQKKICTKCKKEKLTTEFTKRPESEDGYDSRCKSCRNEYQALLRAEKKRYELHFNGQVIVGENPDELKKVSEKIPEPCVIYQILQSKMNYEEKEKEVTKGKAHLKMPPPDKPKIYSPILTYKEVTRAAHAVTNRVSMTMIAKSLYCSLRKLKESLNWFEATQSQEEYEKYDPFKINSENSKTLLHS